MNRRANKGPAAGMLLGVAITLSTLSGLAGTAAADGLPSIPSRTATIGIDTGAVKAKGDQNETAILFSTPVTVAGAKWVRLKFGEVKLAGDAAANGATIRITSKLDGGVQFLNGESLKQWGNTSAYFNGDTVTVELIGFPGTGESRLVIESATAGEGLTYADRTLCGSDQREPSSDASVARLMPMGCSAFMINDANRMFLSAGHCNVNSQTVVQFNVPPSNPDGTLVMPAPQDQYPVDPASVQTRDTAIGSDWAYFGVFPNSNTHMTPVQAQGENLALAAVVPNAGGQVRVTGYGLVTNPIPLSRNQTQQTGTGAYVSRTGSVLGYEVDTTGGNSGSPIIDVVSGRVIGIHTNGGCEGPGTNNEGTSLDNPDLRFALANPRGVCASGTTPPGGGPGDGAIFAAGDASNNFGAFSAGGAFAAVAQTMPNMQGMAYDPAQERFIAVDSSRNVYSITPDGEVTLNGTLAGTTQVISGLAYNAGAQSCYGIAQATGQLFQVHLRVRLVQGLGPARGGNVGGIDFDPTRNALFGVDDASGGTRLVRISVVDGSQTVVGPLGVNATDCNGLAFNPNDQRLYTVDAPTGRLLSINPDTGAASVVGTSNGVFGAAYGMAAREVQVSNCTADFNHDGDTGTDQDIEAFFATLGGNPCPTCGSVDMDGDGDVGTDQDIEAFFRVLGGHSC
ncbi:MAG TPA: trypsin-like peptidase domain-containing protein [Phycisphaerales bacterium]|nr:trypsin-like peptidase domain-containing protein [Phycisphaerales bacterium]